MYDLHENLYLLAVVSLFFAFILVYFTQSSKRLPYAPGPKPHFLFENLFDFPSSDSALHFVEWGRQCKSDILYAKALGTHFIVLNSLKDAEELFEKRAKYYSDRPIAPVVKFMGWDSNMAFMSMGEEWRSHRRLAQQNLRQDMIPEYHSIQYKTIHRMLKGLLDEPELLDYHNKMVAMSIPMAIMYGHDLESLDDPFIVAATRSSFLGQQLLRPGFTLINIFPLLGYIPSWFPGATAQRMLKEIRQLSDMQRLKPMETVKHQLRTGTAVPSMMSRFFCEKERSKEEERLVSGFAFTAYSGASDTIISALLTFFYLMATHPQVQETAQRQLDSVIGVGRLPTFEDRASLPYIEAIYREVLRWRPPNTLGLIHMTAEEDIYRGYCIPKGANIFANVWAMTRDETKYKDPNEFRPERFFSSAGQLNDDDRVLTYGFGRRLCVGKHLASSTMFMAISSVLAVFNIAKAKDEKGNEIEIEENFYDSGIITHKMPFKCSITPRSGPAKRLVEEVNFERNVGDETSTK